LELPAFQKLVQEKARAADEEKEVEYPVMAGLYHFTTRDAGGHKRYVREELAAWAAQRFGVELSLEDLKNKQRDEIRALLVEHSREFAKGQEAAMAEAHAWLGRIFESDVPAEKALHAAHESNGRLQELSNWLTERYSYPLPPEEMLRCTPERLERHLTAAVEDRFRPEMRMMERALVLQLLDAAWKDHLLSMDHLRSSVGLRGYAQIDPKVEYKREGMRIFEQMWDSVGERTTDLIFRMEQLDESFVGSTWTESEAIHQDAQSAGEIASQQQAAIEGTEVDHKPQPIRNRQQRVGRNDPCPCGSGKKFKQCCMRKG
jgi:preprotein translocase subunit SecA